MKRTTISWALLLAVFFLMGCGNALYFYQNERISLTIEGRPDASQPVQGNLGLKQRIAIVTPGLESNGTREPGEALSLISSFRFKKESGQLFNLGPVTIRAALITGDAAKDLSDGQTKAAVEVLTERKIPTYEALARESIARAKAKDQLIELKQLADIQWANLTAQQKSDLGTLTEAFRSYNERLHNAIRKELEK